jgi:hypothetical protein
MGFEFHWLRQAVLHFKQPVGQTDGGHAGIIIPYRSRANQQTVAYESYWYSLQRSILWDLPTFRRNVLRPPSGSESKPDTQAASRDLLASCWLLDLRPPRLWWWRQNVTPKRLCIFSTACFAYTSLTQMEDVSSSEMSVDFYHFCFLSGCLAFVLTMKMESICCSEMSVNRISHLRRWSQYAPRCPALRTWTLGCS